MFYSTPKVKQRRLCEMRVQMRIYHDLISNIADDKTPQSKQYAGKNNNRTVRLPSRADCLFEYFYSRGKRILELVYEIVKDDRDLPTIMKLPRGYRILFHIKDGCQTDSSTYLKQMCLAAIVIMSGPSGLEEYNEFSNSEDLFRQCPDIKDLYYRLYNTLCS